MTTNANNHDNYSEDLLAAETNTQIAVGTTTVAYSTSFKLRRGVSFGLFYKFTSSGTVEVKVELEEGDEPPTTEGSADAAWAVGDIITASEGTEVMKCVTVSPVVANFARLKLTGVVGSNHSSTVIDTAVMTFSKNG